jgi:BlaI family transcriptional regulator, penicillinase repressor
MKNQSSREPIRPTDAELDILNVLWRLGPSTVRQAHEELAQLKPWQYATTLKLMQIMAGKGLLDRDHSTRSHVYRPAIERSDTQRQLVGRMIDRVFEGSVGSLLLGALDARPASKRELDQLRQLIDERAKGRKR